MNSLFKRQNPNQTKDIQKLDKLEIPWYHLLDLTLLLKKLNSKENSQFNGDKDKFN